MPIVETQAKLWFQTKEEEQEYDDKMIASIELKSLDFDDENFSPVFNRKTQEVFLVPSERYKTEAARLFLPITSRTCEQWVDKFLLIKPNHSYWRSLPLEKFYSGLFFGYFILRELPLRNFYARVIIMFAWYSKVYDVFKTFHPLQSPQGVIVGSADRWSLWDVKCYTNVNDARHIRIPSAMNKVPESVTWTGRQPGHLLRADMFYLPHWLGSFSRETKRAYWDGTNNMPIFRLADPKHKDAHMMQWN